MCLLFQKPANVILNDAQLQDFYKSNQDGFGVMYAENGLLHIDKGIGSVDDWIAFMRKYETKEAVWHLRMRTHGDTDLTNCHPYDVYGFDDMDYKVPVAMMHNGVLSTGNLKDVSKSDTWHYIRDFVIPLTKADPDVIFTDAFRELVAEHIGPSNKFAFMDHSGRVAIMNKKSGVEWNGIWFSNTYAWSSRNEQLYPGVNKATYKPVWTGYGGRKVSSWEDESWNNYGKPKTTTHTALPHTTPPTKTVNAPKKSLYKTKKLPKAGKGKWDANHKATDVNGNVTHLPVATVPPSNWVPPGAAEPVKSEFQYQDDATYVIGCLEEKHPQIMTDISLREVQDFIRVHGPYPTIAMIEEVLYGPTNVRLSKSQVVGLFKHPLTAKTMVEQAANGLLLDD